MKKNVIKGGGTCLNAPGSYPEGVNPIGSNLFIKTKAGLLRLKHLTRSRLTSLHSLAVLQACSSLGSLAPRNDAYAFTLAEVLITLGIIGVVSAMTVPSLVQNYQRQSYVTQLHKVYNEVNQALLQYQTNHNALNLKEAGLNSQAALDNFFNTYFKIINKCVDTKTPCFAEEYKNMGGKIIGTNMSNYIVMTSGAAIGYEYSGSPNVLFAFYVDTNGPKGPNIAGRDTFAIYVYNNGMLDDSSLGVDEIAPLSKESREASFEAKCSDETARNWYGCFGKILNDNWQMTY